VNEIVAHIEPDEWINTHHERLEYQHSVTQQSQAPAAEPKTKKRRGDGGGETAQAMHACAASMQSMVQLIQSGAGPARLALPAGAGAAASELPEPLRVPIHITTSAAVHEETIVITKARVHMLGDTVARAKEAVKAAMQANLNHLQSLRNEVANLTNAEDVIRNSIDDA
jgi:hypothetical protein